MKLYTVYGRLQLKQLDYCDFNLIKDQFQATSTYNSLDSIIYNHKTYVVKTSGFHLKTSINTSTLVNLKHHRYL